MEILKDTFMPYGKNNEIVIRNLSKNYGKKTALENVSVTIHSGMYGLLGRNVPRYEQNTSFSLIS